MRNISLLMIGVLLFGWSWSACSTAEPSVSRRGFDSSSRGGADSSTRTGSAGTDQPATVLPTPPAIMSMPTAGTSAATPSSREPVAIDLCSDANAIGVAEDDLKRLLAGGGGPGAKWLYPYDGTVFPRGLGAPLLMWDGPAEAIYVHITAKAFDYKACVKPTMAGQFQLPNDVWATAGLKTYGKSEPYTIELTTLSGGKVAGPSVQHFIIAQANIKGSVYYNSYNSNLASTNGGIGGVVLRIPPGKSAEVFISDPGCNGCHTVSADGSRMLSQVSMGGGQAFQLVVDGPTNPPGNVAGPRTAWGALYPDGSRYLASSAVIDIGNTIMGGGGGGPREATLYDTMSGQPAMSTGIPAGALMPMFSPDGTLLVFNDYALNMAHGLALMKYDVKSHAATPLKTLLQEMGDLRPGWPFVLPDNHAVVFVRTNAATFSGEGAGINFGGINLGGLAVPGLGGAGGGPPISDLNIVDIESGRVTVLARAMGYLSAADATTDKTYLPFGAADLHHNYFPTVSPVAAGGYFWIFFDSLRNYGNLGVGRQLWGTALEIQADGTYTEDPSHPPFYLPGQEFGTGNHRAFTALDPCKMDGNSCTSGIDCCGGFCFIATPPQEFAEPIGTCTPKMMMCSQKDDRCERDIDCCMPQGNNPPYSCIGGFCAAIPLN